MTKPHHPNLWQIRKATLMKPLLLPLLVCSLLLPVTVLHSEAPSEEASKRLRLAIDEVLDAAQSSQDSEILDKKLRPILSKYMSFEAMTRRAVGPGWKQFTSPERERSADLFTSLIIRTYAKKITPGELPKIEFKSATILAPNRVDIPTTLEYKGSRYEVTYRMEKAREWMVTDVIIEGVSFVANYRTQFDALFKKGGALAVLDSLEQSIARTP